MVSSAAGPNFVSRCSREWIRTLTDPQISWNTIQGLMTLCLSIPFHSALCTDRSWKALGLGGGSPESGLDAAYGLSKACLNAYTLLLAREHPQLLVLGCTPGFIETDLTKQLASQLRKSVQDMGMKAPEHGAEVIVPLCTAPMQRGVSGCYFGSDGQRSPLSRYRSPGSAPYDPLPKVMLRSMPCLNHSRYAVGEISQCRA